MWRTDPRYFRVQKTHTSPGFFRTHALFSFFSITFTHNGSLTRKAMFPLRWPFPSPRRVLTSLNLLRLLWLLLFFTIEHFLPRHAISNCSWPLDRPRECQIAIIADPQIVDENTYPRRGVAMWLTKIFTDRYMRRNWEYLMRQQIPGTVIFLGDLMDGGREWEDDKYAFSQFFFFSD